MARNDRKLCDLSFSLNSMPDIFGTKGMINCTLAHCELCFACNNHFAYSLCPNMHIICVRRTVLSSYEFMCIA